MSSSTALLVDQSVQQTARSTDRSIPFVRVPPRVGLTWAEQNGREIPFEEDQADCHLDPNLGEGVVVHCYGPAGTGDCKDHRCGRTEGAQTTHILKCGHEVFLYTGACSLDCMNPRWMLRNGATAQAPQVFGCDYCGIPYLPEQNLLMKLEELEFYSAIPEVLGFSAKLEAQIDRSNQAAWTEFWEDHPERFDPDIIQLAAQGESGRIHDLCVEKLQARQIDQTADSEGEEDIQEDKSLQLDYESDDEFAPQARVPALPRRWEFVMDNGRPEEGFVLDILEILQENLRMRRELLRLYANPYSMSRQEQLSIFTRILSENVVDPLHDELDYLNRQLRWLREHRYAEYLQVYHRIKSEYYRQKFDLPAKFTKTQYRETPADQLRDIFEISETAVPATGTPGEKVLRFLKTLNSRTYFQTKRGQKPTSFVDMILAYELQWGLDLVDWSESDRRTLMNDVEAPSTRKLEIKKFTVGGTERVLYTTPGGGMVVDDTGKDLGKNRQGA